MEGEIESRPETPEPSAKLKARLETHWGQSTFGLWGSDSDSMGALLKSWWQN